MFLVGAITKEELEEVRSHENSWEIQVITKDGVNKMLDPNFNPANYEPEEDDNDLYICVFIDNDISAQLKTWDEEIIITNKRIDRAEKRRVREALQTLQNNVAQDLYEQYDFKADNGVTIVDTMRPINKDNTVAIKFFWEPIDEEVESSRLGTFMVHFKPGTDIVDDFYPNL